MNMTKLLAKLPFGPWRDAGPIVSVLRLSGVIGQAGAFRQGLTMSSMAGLIERAFAPKGQAAVALVVNSPGGSPVQSALIAKRIRDLATEKKVPVFAFCEDAAASGGYWLACAADEIWADESSILGSIGVVSAGFGAHEFIERYGIERRLYTAGDKKVILDPFSPEREDGVAHLKAIQAEIHDAFKAMVRDRRGARLSGAEEELFSGAFWAGRRALELGLIDGIGDLRSVLRGRFGEKVRLRVVQEDRRWFRRMGFRVDAPVGANTLDNLAAALPAAALSAVEERALWSRYGL
ncbi:S49 family peptidase [Azospirillum brasilense]|uniref:S49 family peptidase n=2 Tax=Azospirillum brasilense TaxID=192 RepID=A0A0P0ERI1_AZOBR|nr:MULTISPECIES: S49 family peptidase [Azospirillum]ALJ34662.1 peptidase S49 [Azospirillum brasilense]OPH16335.1 peptidase S49 [Azospirillum brasilense]OPH21733.1 peptidase S49 [Azospirillum brasilense]PWC95270.1 peptidase S49 [Azospirillum sp. Sp 7]QCO09720.1 S49 family peptidase [Azospirillum brasilense]